MVTDNEYFEKVETYFKFLVNEFKFKVESKTFNGNVFFDIEYKSKNILISISYENIEDFLEIIIFPNSANNNISFKGSNENFRLSQLRNDLLTKIKNSDFEKNNKFFIKFKTKNNFERNLLKSAKDLRICLNNLNLI